MRQRIVNVVGKSFNQQLISIDVDTSLAKITGFVGKPESARKTRAQQYFFVNNRGNRYTEQSIRLMLKKYTKQAGIERNITPHMFRHSFATYLIEEGVDVSCVQQILGHSSIKTTQIYIHVAAKKQAEILREMHPRNNMKIAGAA